MNDTLIPELNIRIYKTLYVIENGLRELIISSLSAAHGPFWYKSRMPGDALMKYKEARKFECNIKWQNLVPHHPIYYVDFSHLKQIIERRDSWDEHFACIFGQKDIFMASLSQLETIRNKIAHNRKASRADETAVTDAYSKFEAAIGSKQLQQLVSRPTSAFEIYDLLLSLRVEVNQVLESILQFNSLNSLAVWEQVKIQWWLDESYLCHSIDALKSFHAMVADYMQLPRKRGTGHIIECWLRDSGIHDLCDKALDELSEILNAVEE